MCIVCDVLYCLQRGYVLLAMYTVPFVERTITSVMHTVPPVERTLVICTVPPVESISVLVRTFNLVIGTVPSAERTFTCVYISRSLRSLVPAEGDQLLQHQQESSGPSEET